MRRYVLGIIAHIALLFGCAASDESTLNQSLRKNSGRWHELKATPEITNDQARKVLHGASEAGVSIPGDTPTFFATHPLGIFVQISSEQAKALGDDYIFTDPTTSQKHTLSVIRSEEAQTNEAKIITNLTIPWDLSVQLLAAKLTEKQERSAEEAWFQKRKTMIVGSVEDATQCVQKEKNPGCMTTSWDSLTTEAKGSINELLKSAAGNGAEPQYVIAPFLDATLQLAEALAEHKESTKCRKSISQALTELRKAACLYLELASEQVEEGNGFLTLARMVLGIATIDKRTYAKSSRDDMRFRICEGFEKPAESYSKTISTESSYSFRQDDFFAVPADE